MYPKIEQLVIDQLKLLLETVTPSIAETLSDANRFIEFGIIDLALPRRSGKSVAAHNLSQRLKAPVIYPSHHMMRMLDRPAYSSYTLDSLLSSPVTKAHIYGHIIADELSQKQLTMLISYLLYCISVKKANPNLKLISLRTPCV